MNLWSHCFSQNTDKKLSGFLPCVEGAEILTIFCSYFWRNDDFLNSFWNSLTFNKDMLLCIKFLSLWGCYYLRCATAHDFTVLSSVIDTNKYVNSSSKNLIFLFFRFQNFYLGWVVLLVQQNLEFLQKQLEVIVEELPIRLLKLKMK